MKLTEEILHRIGFVKDTIVESLPYSYELGSGRTLLIYYPGGSNEMMLIIDRENRHMATLHNYEYDGPLQEEQIHALIWSLTKSIPKSDESVQV